jgi:superoxide dismutase, Cu-Zn family
MRGGRRLGDMTHPPRGRAVVAATAIGMVPNGSRLRRMRRPEPREVKMRVFPVLLCSSLLGAALTLPLLAQGPGHATVPAPADAGARKAIAVLHPTAGNQVSGTVAFTQEDGAVRVVADLAGLPPGTTHGFHIHELGDCSAADGSSAGGHFNPTGMPHAGPTTAMRHGGDLGNVVADATGKAHLELTVDNVTVQPGPTCILGRGVIVHVQQDDFTTQPTGNAGARVACGVIGIAR